MEVKVSNPKICNMVAERWAKCPFAMMLQEAIRLELGRFQESSKEKQMAEEVALTGLGFLPSTMPNLGRQVRRDQKESTVVGPVLPFWGSSGERGAE